MKFFLFILFFVASFHLQGKNLSIGHFSKAKKKMQELHREHPFTLYCGCRFTGNTIDLKSCGYKVFKDPKRAARLEWEHVVPAEAFGRSFKEWREGHEKCVNKGKKFKGRRCAKTNPEFAKMEADLYNIYPEIGELNHLRSNFSMTEFGKNDKRLGSKTFGACGAIIADRKFGPMDRAKGVVARTYMYMHESYPGRGIISKKNEKLFATWNKLYAVTDWECARAKKIEQLQGNENKILKLACLGK